MILDSGFSGAVLVQVLGFLLLAAIPTLIIVALLKFKKVTLPPQTQAVWVLIILLIPILGAIAFLIVKPGDTARSSS